MVFHRKILTSLFLAAVIAFSAIRLKSKETIVRDGVNPPYIDNEIVAKGVDDVIIHNDSTELSNSRDTIRRDQIRNYREGKALIINIHITHQGGTTLCRVMKNYGPTPAFACNGGANWDFDVPNGRNDRPWTFNQTSEYIPIVREHFHMISWEFGFKPKRLLKETDWENPLLVSVLIVKDPIDRLFGASARLNKIYGHWSVRNQSSWWEYAQLSHTDNFALHKLSPKPCPSGENTSLACLEAAKDVVKRFTYILDIACLDESMAVLAEDLGLRPPEVMPHKIHPSAAERLGNATLYDWLRRRNRRDIELYQWARDRALVNCSDLPEDI